jgi:hypothetical protein
MIDDEDNGGGDGEELLAQQRPQQQLQPQPQLDSYTQYYHHYRHVRVFQPYHKSNPYFLTLDLFRYKFHQFMTALLIINCLVQLLLTQVFSHTLIYLPNWVLHYSVILYPVYIVLIVHNMKIMNWWIQQIYKTYNRRVSGRR